MREQDIECKYTINQEVIILTGLYRNNKAIIQSVKQEKETIIYTVKLKVMQDTTLKTLTLEFDESKLKPKSQFKIPFVN